MFNYLTKEKLFNNFLRCKSWKERYSYIVELGSFLPPMPIDMHSSKYLVSGCQSQTWVAIINLYNKKIEFYGDSDSAIVKGIIALIFILYNKLTLQEIILFDVQSFFDKLNLFQNLTFSRSQSLGAIICALHLQAKALLKLIK